MTWNFQMHWKVSKSQGKKGVNVTGGQKVYFLLSLNVGLKAQGWGQLALSSPMFHGEWQGTDRPAALSVLITKGLWLLSSQALEVKIRAQWRRESVGITCILSYVIHPKCWSGQWEQREEWLNSLIQFWERCPICPVIFNDICGQCIYLCI